MTELEPKQTDKPVKKIVSWRTVLLVVIAMILGLSIYSWNAETLVGNKMPMPFGIGVSVVMSGSMEPRLSIDDLVVIKKTDEVKVDDIVVFQEGNMLIIHRVISINGGQITTKGDGNLSEDTPIGIGEVKGVLIFDVPYVGGIVRIIKNPIVAVVLLFAAVFMTNRSFRKEKDKDADELDEIKKEIKELINDMKEK